MSNDPTEIVKSWFNDPQHWAGSGKSSQCIDRKLLLPEMVKDKVVLNLGCFFPEDEHVYGGLAKRWVAVDFSEDVITRCKGMTSTPSTVEYLLMDMRNLDFPNNTFDLICDFSSGDHIDEAGFRQTLGEVYRVLKPGMHFLITYANANFFCAGEDPPQYERYGEAGYTRLMSPAQAWDYLYKAGFE